MAFIARSPEVFSNARVKIYPYAAPVFQAANAPIFRAAGWEQERAYDVPPKGEGTDPERAAECSRARARAAVKDITRCNRFTHFFTWTLDGKLIDRYDAEEVKRKVCDFLKNAVRRKGFAYVAVAERHKDGALHLHGLCMLGSFKPVRAFSPYTAKPLYTDSGRPIFNMPEWKWGFSSCIPIDENYECTVNYVVKYISKDSEKLFGKWYLSSRNLRKRPDIELVEGGVDFDAFAAEHPEMSSLSLYRDVKLFSCPLPQNGGVPA